MAYEGSILESIDELVNMLKADGSLVEQADFNHGESLLKIYTHPQQSSATLDFQATKLAFLREVILDISGGCEKLKKSTMGLCFAYNQVQNFCVAKGDMPAGKILFSIELKKPELTQEEIHAVIYRLAVMISYMK
ncbi:MAG: hypothetical protein AB7O96_10690 [Pseudobdellovibrionaceae bacterium]